MLKFLIAVDGSEHARHAIEAVAKVAKFAIGLEAVLLNVRNGPVYYGEIPVFDYEDINRVLCEQQEKLLSEALAYAQNAGLERVATLSSVGEVAGEIIRMAKEEGVDQIVMGTRGMGALGALFLGSQAQRVIHMSDIPVLLVK